MSDVEDVGTAVVTGGLSLPVQAREERRAAERDIRRARRTDRRIQNIRAARERRQQIRQARIQRADIEAGAIATGAVGSSSAVTGAGTVGTQLASNLSFLDTVNTLQNKASIFRERATEHQAQAGEFQEVFDLGVRGVKMFSGGA